MQLNLAFKTPDVTDAIRDQLSSEFSGDELEEKVEEAMSLIKKFVEYHENINIVFDTDKQAATVLPL